MILKSIRYYKLKNKDNTDLFINILLVNLKIFIAFKRKNYVLQASQLNKLRRTIYLYI